MPAVKPGARRLQILQVLARMLENPKGEKVTTAALAKELDVSEAALYRHFASKAQMFEGLIEFIEQTLKQCLRVAATQGHDSLAGSQLPADPGPQANLMLCYVIGRWQLYAKSGFKRTPSELWEKQWPLLL